MKRLVPSQLAATRDGNFLAKILPSVSSGSLWKSAGRMAGFVSLMLLFSSGIMAVTTITVNSVSISGSRICPGESVSLNFTVDTTGGATMPAGSYVWTAELSDPSGNFPGTSLGLTAATNYGARLGPIGANVVGPFSLPSSLAQSNLYKIRLTVNGYPAVVSVASPALDARRELLAPNTDKTKYCAGDDITVKIGRAHV